MLTVRVGDVEFHGHAGQGFLIGPGGFVGWEGAPANRRESSDRPGSHGSFAAGAWKGSRLLRLSGTALASSEAELAYMGDVLSGVGGSTSRVTVTTAAGTRWADGSVEGEIRFDRVGGALEAAYALSLWFPNPRKFGAVHESSSSSATVTAHHYGNFEATPQFTVAGTFPNGYALHALGRVVQVAGVAGAVTDRVDFRTGMVTRNNALNPTLLQQGQFWTVAGGASVSWRLDPLGGSGTATCFLTDTFI